MTKTVLFLGLVAFLIPPSLLPTPVHAEAIPEYALNKDFENCMGGQSAQSDPQRASYCNCIRDDMRSWDLDTYGAIATEQSKAGNAEQVPQKIADLAKACIAKVLKN